jgi:hypothetical protein
MLSFDKGLPIARINGGIHNGRVICISDPSSTPIGCDPLLLLGSEFYHKKKRDDGKKMSAIDMFDLGEALRSKTEPEGPIKSIYYQALEQLTEAEKKEIHLEDGEVIPLPNLDKIDDGRECLYLGAPSGSGKSTWIARWCAEYREIDPEKRIFLFSRIARDPVLDLLDPIRIPLDQALIDAIEGGSLDEIPAATPAFEEKGEIAEVVEEKREERPKAPAKKALPKKSAPAKKSEVISEMKSGVATRKAKAPEAKAETKAGASRAPARSAQPAQATKQATEKKVVAKQESQAAVSVKREIAEAQRKAALATVQMIAKREAKTARRGGATRQPSLMHEALAQAANLGSAASTKDSDRENNLAGGEDDAIEDLLREVVEPTQEVRDVVDTRGGGGSDGEESAGEEEDKTSEFIDLLRGSICIFDDIDTIPEKKLLTAVYKLRDDLLETGRHFNITVICTSHLIANGIRTRPMLNEASSVTIYPKASTAYHVKRILKDYFGVPTKLATRVLELPTRWVTLYKGFPQFLLYERGAMILSSMDSKPAAPAKKK